MLCSPPFPRDSCVYGVRDAAPRRPCRALARTPEGSPTRPTPRSCARVDGRVGSEGGLGGSVGRVLERDGEAGGSGGAAWIPLLCDVCARWGRIVRVGALRPRDPE